MISTRLTIMFVFFITVLFVESLKCQEIEPVLPVPTQQQLEWQQLELIFFAHFGVNTFTNREWGDGKEDPSIFNPSEFDANQWARVVKEAGGKMIILTCKHHDGFCMWPSEYTEHSVENSPWKNGQGDVVREVSEACQEYGLKFGVYLSPWDRNHPEYGNSPVYNQYFVNQLTELLTQYGEIAEVWFDGANGEGPNGKRQVYDWQAYYQTIRSHQPNAVIAIVGPDVRWVGNESGVAHETEWSVQIVSEGQLDDARIQFNPTMVEGNTRHLLEGIKTMDDAAFSHLANQPDQVTQQAKLIWYPSETDTSIRPGWFYHPEQDDKVKSLEHLIDIYFKSVGRGTVLLLNVPPDPRGLFHENDVARLKELRRFVDQTFETNLAWNANVITSHQASEQYSGNHLVDGDDTTYWASGQTDDPVYIELDLGNAKTFDVIALQEPIELGQRIAEFKVEVWKNDSWQALTEVTTIGYKRLLRVPETTNNKIRIQILKSRGQPVLHTIGLYKQPSLDSGQMN